MSKIYVSNNSIVDLLRVESQHYFAESSTARTLDGLSGASLELPTYLLSCEHLDYNVMLILVDGNVWLQLLVEQPCHWRRHMVAKIRDETVEPLRPPYWRRLQYRLEYREPNSSQPNVWS